MVYLGEVLLIQMLNYLKLKFRYESREKICRLANEFKVSRLTIRRIVNPSLRSFNRLV